MSAIAGAATNLIQSPFGGFAPFPNSIMIPFMATQSAVLGYNFGIGYEIGKRTIKSLDNDFFNKIRAGSTDVISVVSDGKEIKMGYNEYISFITKRHGHEQIAIFESMIPNFMKLQDTIIDKSVDIELKKAERTPSAMVEIVKAFGGSTAKEVKTQLDTFGDVEKAFIIAASPILGLLYVFGGGDSTRFKNTGPKEPEPAPTIDSGFQHKQIVDHEQHPFHPDNEPRATEPQITIPKGKQPEPPSDSKRITLKFTYDGGHQYNFSEVHTQTEWDKIIRYWKLQVDRLKPSATSRLRLVWKNLQTAYRYHYGIYPR